MLYYREQYQYKMRSQNNLFTEEPTVQDNQQKIQSSLKIDKLITSPKVYSSHFANPCRFTGLLLFVISGLAYQVAAAPIVTSGTPVCSGSWFHGYQSLGITFTVGDSNSNFFVIGGSVPYGCSVLDSTQTYLKDQCAIVEYFNSFAATSPTFSVILSQFPYSSTVKLGITGILALTKSKNQAATTSVGVVQIGVGAQYSSSASYIPDGTELAMFSVDSTKLNYYYMPAYFQGYNCAVNKKTTDRYDGSQIWTIAFQNCATLQNYVVQLKQNTGALVVVSLTQFPQSQLKKWYTVTNDGVGNGFLLTGIAPYNTFQSLRWLVTDSSKSDATQLSSPLCDYNLIYDSQWSTRIGSTLYPAVAKWASCTSCKNEGVVALHNPGSYAGFALILTWDKVCTSNFDLINKEITGLYVTVLDLQLFYNSLAQGVELQILVEVNSRIYLISGIQNDYKKGWKDYGGNPNVKQLTIVPTSTNPLFAFSLSDVDLSTVFLFKDKQSMPVLFGHSNKYWSGLNDGFMWRDSTQSCLTFKTTSSTSDPFSSMDDRFCYFKPPSVTPTDHYTNGVASCNTGNVGTQAQASQATILTVPSLLSQSTQPPSFWTSSASYSVKNPCMLQFQSTTTTPQNIQLGTPSLTPIFTLSIKHNCAYTSLALSTLKLDYSLISVAETLVPASTTLNVASYVAPTYTPSPYTYTYQIKQMTDYTLVKSWKATFQFTLQGDTNSVVFLDTTTLNIVNINVLGCSPAATFPPVLPDQSISIGIGNPHVFDMYNLFQNGDCAYSSASDTSQIWPLVQVYQKEVLVLSGSVKVTSTTTHPVLTISTSDQNLEGTYFYTFQYTDYKGTLYNMQQKFTFLSTQCKTGVTGLESVVETYYQSILNTTALAIDVSAVLNNECGYSFDVFQQSGPLMQNFLAITSQPTFRTISGSTSIMSLTTPGAISVGALTGTIPQKQAYVGIYTFQLIVKDALTPFTTRATRIFQVEICDCANQWNPSLNLTAAVYYLSQTLTIDVPAFVDTSVLICNSVTTSFSTVSNEDLSAAVTLLQNSTVLGTSQLTIQTGDPTLRKSYVLKITSTDINGYFLSFYMPLQIKHMCEDSSIDTFSYFEQTITLNDTQQTYQIPQFNQTITGCDEFVYSVSFAKESGQYTTNLIEADLSSLLLTISNPGTKLTGPSIVRVTVKGTIQGQDWLPSKEAYFKLLIVSEIQQLIPQVQNKTTVKIENKTQNLTFTTNTTYFQAPITDKKPLIPTIVAISSSGTVRVKFSSNLVIPSMYVNVGMRRQEPEYIETIDQFLALKVKSGVDDLNRNRTKIVRFNLTDFQRSYILLQVDFLNPEDLSHSYTQPDLLIIQFKDAQIFVSETQVVLANETEIRKPIPTQVGLTEAAQVAQLTSTVSSGMNTIATINLVVNIILSFGLKYLWNFVNLLQFLVFIPRWNIKIPLNALAVLQQLKSIALMEFIPTKEITGKISGWLAMDPNDDSNIMNSMGLMLLIGLAILVIVVALAVASYFVQKNYSAYKRYRGIKESIFYNAFLRYMLQSVLKVGLASGTTLSAISWSNFQASSAVSVLTSSLILFIMGTGPLLFTVILKKNFDRLPRPSTKKQIGTLYLAINDQDKFSLAYSPIFMLRRLLFIAITFGMTRQPGLQIHLFSYLNLFYVMFLGLVVPHDIKSMTSSELVNESILMLSCYHFILFTGVVDDQSTRTNIGWSLSGFIGLLLMFNVSVILWANFVQLRRKYTLWRLRQKQKEANQAKLDKVIKEQKVRAFLQSRVDSNTKASERQPNAKQLVQFQEQPIVWPQTNVKANRQSEQDDLQIQDYSYREPAKTEPLETYVPLKLKRQTPAPQISSQVVPTNQDDSQTLALLKQIIESSKGPVKKFQSASDQRLDSQPNSKFTNNQFTFGSQLIQPTNNKQQIQLDETQNRQRLHDQEQFKIYMTEKARQIQKMIDVNRQQKNDDFFL